MKTPMISHTMKKTKAVRRNLNLVVERARGGSYIGGTKLILSEHLFSISKKLVFVLKALFHFSSLYLQ